MLTIKSLFKAFKILDQNNIQYTKVLAFGLGFEYGIIIYVDINLRVKEFVLDLNILEPTKAPQLLTQNQAI